MKLRRMLSRGAILDRDTIDAGDINFSPLEIPGMEWRGFGETPAALTQERIADAEVVISNKVVLNEANLTAASHLKLICLSATGTNNVDLEAAARLGITICNVTAYCTDSVVEHVFALILVLRRNLLAQTESMIQGRWQNANLFCLLDRPMGELAGTTLGIVGYGELGRAVSKVAEAFGMHVLVAQRPGSAASDGSPGRVSLDTVLAKSDVVSLHCPLTDATRGLIGERELGLMKIDALLINTARGGIVDEIALAAFLQQRRIGGAGIDVLSEEPPKNGNALLEAGIPNLIVTPHVAWASRVARQRLVRKLGENLRAYMNDAPINLVVDGRITAGGEK